MPYICAGLGQTDVRQNAIDELLRHLHLTGRMVVMRRDDGIDGGTGLGRVLHVAQVDGMEGRFANTEHETAALLQTNIGSTFNEVGGHAVGDAGEGSHGAGEYDHRVNQIAATGDGCANIFRRVLLEFGEGRGVIRAKKFFDEVRAATEVEFFGKDAECIFRGDKVNAGYAGIGGQSAEHLASVNCPTGTGYGEG